MDTQAIQKLKDLLAKNERIGIAVGSNHTLDDMASALSLYLAMQAAGKKASIATPGDPLVAVSSLVGINKVKKELDGEGGDLVVSFPYKEGEIEKVSYTLEGGLLNIIVKAGVEGLAFEEKDVVFKRAGGMPQVLFVVGTPRIADLGNLFNPDTLKDVAMVNIDTKPENQGFGDVVLVSPTYSTVSEAVLSLLESLGIQVDIDMAQNLLTGITSGTDNFQKPTVNAYTFESAAALMKKGAVRPKVAAPSFVNEQDPFTQSMMMQQGQRPQQGQRRDSMQDMNRQPNRQFPRPQQSFGQQRTQQQRPQPQQQQAHQQQPAARPSWQQAPEFMTTPSAQDKDASQAKERAAQDEEAPPDWLAPKVYKGSTNI